MSDSEPGRPAWYIYAGLKQKEPVTLIRVCGDGEAVIVFADGRLEKVPLHRVRLVTP